MDRKQWQAEQAQFNDTSRYNDIMDTPRHVSRAHLPMPPADRAGQFAPFAALTGYRELLDKIAKRYANKEYPTAKQLTAIFAFLHQLSSDKGTRLKVTYFNGESGYYDTYEGLTQSIDWAKQVIKFVAGPQIAIRNIKAISLAKEVGAGGQAATGQKGQ